MHKPPPRGFRSEAGMPLWLLAPLYVSAAAAAAGFLYGAMFVAYVLEG